MSDSVDQPQTRDPAAIAGALLVATVPSAGQVYIHDFASDRTRAINNDDDPDGDLIPVAELTADLALVDDGSAVSRQTLGSGDVALAVPVVTAGRSAMGALIAIFPKNAVRSANFDAEQAVVVMRAIAEAFAESQVLQAERDAALAAAGQVQDELDLIYSVDQKVHGLSRRHAGLAELVGQSGRFLGVGYSVLLLPTKRIRISATHSTWKSVNRRAVDRYLVETLMPQMQGRTTPVVYDIDPVATSERFLDERIQALASPLLDARGNIEGVIAQLGQVTGRPFGDADKRLMAHVMRKVQYVIEQSFDTMTGLMNRAGFEAQLRESIRSLKSARHQVVYFDLDNLQLVNDSFGRDAGDQVIIRFARLLEESLPRNAIASRLTGDDFVILLTKATEEDALAVAQAVRAQGDRLRFLAGTSSLQVSVSVGIAAIEAGSDVGEVLTAARIACDKAKDYGRDRIELHDQDDKSIIRRYDDMQLVTHIQQALDNDEFVLQAQPIVDAKSLGRVPQYEILLRVREKNGETCSPVSIISAAERYHLMPQIDRWVIATAIRMIAPHAERFVAEGTAFSINLSGQSIGDDQMLAFIEGEIDAARIPHQILTFEITESAAVSKLDKAQTFIRHLRERGCHFSLDDFGAGLSSFAYLKNLEVDTLKIDGGFIRDIATDKISRSMVAAITQVAAVMNLKTVAEYVGDRPMQELLASLSVDYLQGHGVGRPVDLQSILEEPPVEAAQSA